MVDRLRDMKVYKRWSAETKGEVGRVPWWSVLVFVAIVVLTVCLMMLYTGQRLEMGRLAREIVRLEDRRDDLADLNRALKLEVATYESITEVEDRARNGLGLVDSEGVRTIIVPARVLEGGRTAGEGRNRGLTNPFDGPVSAEPLDDE
ncbi:MAG: FtsB family cell division protein [bacterium]